MEKLRIKYITDKQTIDVDSIKEFQFMENRRRLRQEQVNRIGRGRGGPRGRAGH